MTVTFVGSTETLTSAPGSASAVAGTQAGDIAVCAYRGTLTAAPTGWSLLGGGTDYGVYVKELTAALGAETWTFSGFNALLSIAVYRGAGLPEAISWGADASLVGPSIDTEADSVALSVAAVQLNHGAMSLVVPAGYTKRAGYVAGTTRVHIAEKDMASGGATGTATWTTNGSGSMLKVGMLELAEPAPSEQHESGGSTATVAVDAEGAGAAWQVIARSEPAAVSVGPSLPWVGVEPTRPWEGVGADEYLGVAYV